MKILPARNRELTRSETFTSFLIEELIPWLCRTYLVTADPAFTVVGGSSNGGHEYLNWRGTLADGLIALLGKLVSR